MRNLQYEFLDPFMEKELVKEGISKKQVLADFEKINWHELVKDSFSGNQDGNTKKKEADPRNDFWYFNISYSDVKHQKSQLLIVPNFAINDSFLENDLRFSLEYSRPKMVEVPKWKQFFGSADKKLVTDFSTCIREINFIDTRDLLVQFLDGENRILENRITETGPLFLNRFD